MLNYAPAIAEAYYQKVPLLVITADRPGELIDQGDGQTIRQNNVYANYVKASVEIPGDIQGEEAFRSAVQKVSEAIDRTCFPDFGPVHINIPFEEPIYNQVSRINDIIHLEETTIKPELPAKERMAVFADAWNKSTKKLIVAGMMDPDPGIRKLLHKLAEDPSVVVLSETTSNLMNDCSCPCIDRVVSTITARETEDFRPDLLVSFGGNVVSKMIKAFLRTNKPGLHWHIDPVDFRMNTYQCLTDGIPANAAGFLSELLPLVKPVDSTYSNLWHSRDERSEIRHREYLEACDYSDLKVFEAVLDFIPEHSNLQLGNSTPVRYAQLFKQKKDLVFHSNRGTSGIDGAVSTAAGAAFVNGMQTTLITGDLGFFYDSNALMNHHLKPNLRIIIINNRGGGIFRFITGPGETDQLEEFFEAHHNWTAEYIARNFQIPYYSVCNLEELKTTLPGFYSPQEHEKPAILEIHTPNKKNARILATYFKKLKE